MGILKKGSKGSDTKGAQKLLNKSGAKLKEDGIFGPITEAATRKFQKKVKLKADGIIGPLTTAALKYGKPLPEMATSDYVKFLAKLKTDSKDNGDIISIQLDAKRTLSQAATKANAEIEKAYEAYNASYLSWQEIFKSGNEVVAKQKQFDKLVTKDPAAAEKLAKECAVLDAKIQSIGKKTISPNSKKANDALARASKAMDEAVKAVEDCRKAVKAEKSTW